MGNGESAEKFNLRDLSPCNLYKATKEIKGLSSNSASPTDTWIVTLHKGTTYEEEGVYIDKVFIKLFINQNSWKQYLEKPLTDCDSKMCTRLNLDFESLLSLSYEQEIYKMIRELVDKKICPNFVRCYAMSQSCTYDNLVEFVKAVNVDQSNLDRNIMYMATGKAGRPSITRDKEMDERLSNTYDVVSHVIPVLKFGFIVTESINPDKSMTMTDFLSQDNILDNPEFYCVLFQVVYACKSMFMAKIAHNDIHTGNIWVCNSEGQVDVQYTVGDAKGESNYLFHSPSKIAKVYDFDRSYSPRVGTNYILNDPGTIESSQSNQLIRGRDVAKVFCYVYDRTGKSTSILKLITSKPETFRDIYTKVDGCFLQKDNTHAVDPEVYEDLYTYNRILKNIYAKYKALSHKVVKKDGLPLKEYKCLAKYFTKDGQIMRKI